jgi:hypothetical protein
MGVNYGLNSDRPTIEVLGWFGLGRLDVRRVLHLHPSHQSCDCSGLIFGRIRSVSSDLFSLGPAGSGVHRRVARRPPTHVDRLRYARGDPLVVAAIGPPTNASPRLLPPTVPAHRHS